MEAPFLPRLRTGKKAEISPTSAELRAFGRPLDSLGLQIAQNRPSSYIYIYIYVCIYRYVWYENIYGCGSKPVSSRGSPPLLQAFVAGALLQTLVADLCVQYCSLQGACRGRVCRRTPPSVTNLCLKMAAQACYKANVFDSLPYMCLKQMHIYIYVLKAPE